MGIFNISSLPASIKRDPNIRGKKNDFDEPEFQQK